MKDIKLVDTLPSVFGVVALIGFFITHPFTPGEVLGPWGTLGPMLLYGAGLIALITGVVSLLGSTRNKSSVSLRWVNGAWVLAIGLFFAWIIKLGLSFHISG